jgi:predicted site-specific integrase-resolvase
MEMTMKPNAAPPLPRLGFTLRETAASLGISYESAYRLVKRGLLRPNTSLRTKIFSRVEIDRFLALK